MADRYAVEYVGVKDGTVPVKLADGRVVDSKFRRIRATKQVLADAIGDRVFIGTLPVGANLARVWITSDTSLSTSTIAVGTTAVPAKYVAARTFTTPLDAPTVIGPKASALDDTPLAVEEDIWVTVAALALPVAAIVVFELEYTISA